MEERLSQSVIAPFFEAQIFVGVVAFPLFFDSVDVEDSLLLAVLDDLRRGSSHRKVNAEVDLSQKDLVKNLLKVLLCESDLQKLHLRILLGQVHRFGVNDRHLLKLEVPLY